MAVVSENLQVLKVQDDSDSVSIRRDTIPKSAGPHVKIIKDDELRPISRNGQIQRSFDVSQLSNPSMEKNAVVTRSNISRRGIELPSSSSKGPKTVTKMYKTCEMQEPAGVVLPSGTSAMQILPQNEICKRALKAPLTQLTSKNQAKAVESSRMLVTVNVCGSTGPLRFLVDLKDPVNRVIELALRAYAREGRLPHLGINCKAVELFCANSNFEALDPVQSVGSLGTRHFLLYKRRNEEVEHMAKKTANVVAMPWKFMWNMMNINACSH